MGNIDNFRDYLNHKNEYSAWAREYDLNPAKKKEYFKNNKFSNADKEEDIKRAKIVLNAINTMDEYSQKKAEDMQIVEQIIALPLVCISSFLSSKLASCVKNNTFVKNNKILNKVIPPLMGAASLIPPFLVTLFTCLLAADKESVAAKYGRIYAMTNNLASVNQFAVLTPEQTENWKNIANNFDKMLPKNEGKPKVDLLYSTKLLFCPDKKAEENLAYIRKTTEYSKDEIGNIKLDDFQTLQAKKDKQLINTVTERINSATQEAVQKTEIMTVILSTLAAGSGIITNSLSELILKFTKISAENKTRISNGIGMMTGFGLMLLSVKFQKYAAKVAKFNVKQDMLNNPEQLIYINDETLKLIKLKDEPNKKKDNYFSWLKNFIADSREYQNYQKNNSKKHLMKLYALEKINLTEEQKQRAKQLQKNVFMVFNKSDDKAQDYSGSTAAIEQILHKGIAFLTGSAAYFGISKNIKNSAINSTAGKIHPVLKSALKTLFITMLPAIAIDLFIGKQSKESFKVANMLALKEIDDYRNYAYINKE